MGFVWINENNYGLLWLLASLQAIFGNVHRWDGLFIRLGKKLQEQVHLGWKKSHRIHMFDGGHNFMWCGFSLKIYIFFFFLIPYHIQKHEWINALNTVGSGFFYIFMSFVAVLFSGHSARADTKLLTHFYTYLILCAMKRMKSKICIASCWIFATAHQIREFSFRLCDLNYVVLGHLFRLHGPNNGNQEQLMLCYASFLIHGSLTVCFVSVCRSVLIYFKILWCGMCVTEYLCLSQNNVAISQFSLAHRFESHSSSTIHVYAYSIYVYNILQYRICLFHTGWLFFSVWQMVCVCDNMVIACDVHATDSRLKQRFSLQWYVVAQQHTSTNRAEQSRTDYRALNRSWHSHTQNSRAKQKTGMYCTFNAMLNWMIRNQPKIITIDTICFYERTVGRSYLLASLLQALPPWCCRFIAITIAIRSEAAFIVADTDAAAAAVFVVVVVVVIAAVVYGCWRGVVYYNSKCYFIFDVFAIFSTISKSHWLAYSIVVVVLNVRACILVLVVSLSRYVCVCVCVRISLTLSLRNSIFVLVGCCFMCFIQHPSSSKYIVHLKAFKNSFDTLTIGRTWI